MAAVNVTEPERGKMKSAMTESAHSETGSLHGNKPGVGAVPKDRERKIGHRRVDEKTGTVTYKKKTTSELQAAIQLGIGQSVGGLTSKPERDLLMQDFGVVQSVVFPSEGSNMTPAHHCSDFRFKTYAPLAFRYFRDLFNIQPGDFMISLCDEPMNELSNPGAGGSIFYISADDEFIIKTAQHKEAGFLQKLLPGYYMNLNQNPRTLLPKFYGLFCYQCGGKNIRFVVMNNILPSTVKMHEKYDLKGSTYKRKASKSERLKSSPTLKDLDFMDLHPEGLLLEKETYDALVKTIQRDCRVLESFKIMDYSLLMGIHNLDQAKRDRQAVPPSSRAGTSTGDIISHDSGVDTGEGKPRAGLARGKSVRTKVTQYSTPMESIQVEAPDRLEEFDDDEDIPPGGIPAKNAKGERLYLYLGIIDILQYYRFRKKFEHTFKSMITDGDTVSVTRPSFYSERFQKFFMNTVFRKAPSPLKHSPSKRKAGERGPRTTSITINDDPNLGKTGARPDLLMDSSTPPPTFDEALSSKPQTRDGRASVSPKPGLRAVDSDRSDRPFFQTIQQQESNMRVRHSPISVTESTPTYTDFTEGTPSYTPSSPSCCSDVLDNNIPNLPLEQGSAISLTHESVTGSPSRIMGGSVSTEASYHSAVSHMDMTSERQSQQVFTTVTRTDERVIHSSSSVSNTQTVGALNSRGVSGSAQNENRSVNNSGPSGEVTLREPRISVESQASSVTSSYAASLNDGAYNTESTISSSSDPSESTVKMETSIKSGIVDDDTVSPLGGELIPDEDASTHL